MSTNTNLAPADAARMIVGQLCYYTEAADKACTEFAAGVAKNGPGHTIRWGADTVRAEAVGRSARLCLVRLDGDTDPELVASVVGGMVAEHVNALLERYESPSSSSSFSNAVTDAEGDARASFVRSFRPLVDMLNEALS